MVNLNVLLSDLWVIIGIVPKTLAMAMMVFALAVLVGAGLATIEHKNISVLKQMVVAYKVILKGPPIIIVIFLSYFGLPVAFQFLASLVGIEYDAYSTPNWVILVTALIFCYSAFEAEIIKGALNSFDTGQSDAARSLGYTDHQMVRRIMFPQVVVNAIPDLTTSLLIIMKALALGFAIEVVEIFAQAQILASLNYYYLEAFLAATIVYMVIAYCITLIADKAESTLRMRS